MNERGVDLQPNTEYFQFPEDPNFWLFEEWAESYKNRVLIKHIEDHSKVNAAIESRHEACPSLSIGYENLKSLSLNFFT
jgi:hypothetical protein